MAAGMMATAIISSLCLAEKGDRDEENEEEYFFHNGCFCGRNDKVDIVPGRCNSENTLNVLTLIGYKGVTKDFNG